MKACSAISIASLKIFIFTSGKALLIPSNHVSCSLSGLWSDELSDLFISLFVSSAIISLPRLITGEVEEGLIVDEVQVEHSTTAGYSAM